MGDEIAGPSGGLRSQPSTEKVCIRFFNATNSVVDVIWIDFNGAYKSYQLLRKGQFLDVYTYTKHPWIAIDDVTRQRLLVDEEYVYFPKTPLEFIRLYQEKKKISREISPCGFNHRTLVLANITSPLHTLRYTTLLMLSGLFKDVTEVDNLELPRQLKEDLKNIITQKVTNKDIVPT